MRIENVLGILAVVALYIAIAAVVGCIGFADTTPTFKTVTVSDRVISGGTTACDCAISTTDGETFYVYDLKTCANLHVGSTFNVTMKSSGMCNIYDASEVK